MCNSVYCIFEGDFEFSHFNAGYQQPSSLFYFGSTAVGVAKRHLNRMAVYRRLKKTEFVDAEFSLRYWASHNNLFDFEIVPLQSFADYQAAWTFEHELIAQWQTPLNYPGEMQCLKKTALGFRVSCRRRMSAYATFGLRLWRKLRKRLHGQRKQFTVNSTTTFKVGKNGCETQTLKLGCCMSLQPIPDRCFVRGRAAAGLEEFESLLPSVSAASTFFPGRNSWKSRSRALFDLWLKRNRLPHALHAVCETFCDEQRALHVQALQESGRLTWSKVQEVKSKLHHPSVLYNEDHHPTCYCPQFFIRSLSTTWDNPDAWAINPKAELPRGTVFLKRKKQFQKGRTIISCSGCLCSKFLQLASFVITIMTRTLYPDAPGMQSMLQLWRSLHHHWSKPSHEPDLEWTDDLVGFI